MARVNLARALGGARRLPVGKVLALAEIVMLAREHITKLEPNERRRFLELLSRGRGRPSKLTTRERAELMRLVAKADPRLFARTAAGKLSPVPLPRRKT
jgi:hypothetical protein